MKQFLIVGSINCIHYANVFPYLKSREVHYRPECCGIKEYDNTDMKVTATWYTTMETPYISPLVLTKSYNPDDYPKYDNYDAINVDKTKDIPYDYQGVMGVPTTFLGKWNPEQFEILGCASDQDWLRSIGVQIMGKETVKMLRSQGNMTHVTANMNSLYYIKDNKVFLPYSRLFIRHRK